MLKIKLASDWTRGGNRPLALAAAVLLAAGLAGLAGCGPSRENLIQAGDQHYYSAHYVEAIGPYKKALQISNASDPEVLYRIGQCYRYLGDYREAAYWFERTLRSYPGHRGAAAGLDEARARMPRFTAPEETTQAEALSSRVRSERLIEVARTYESAGDLERALLNYQRAVDLAESQAYPHAELGRFYMRTGRNDQAIQELKRARELNVSEPKVAEDLAVLGAN